MSADEIQEIIRRSVTDRAFAKALRDHFHKALEGYKLSSVEMAALRAMQIEFVTRKAHHHRPKKNARPKYSAHTDYYQLD